MGGGEFMSFFQRNRYFYPSSSRKVYKTWSWIYAKNLFRDSTSEVSVDPFICIGNEKSCPMPRQVLQETVQWIRLKQLFQNWYPLLIILCVLSHSLLCPHSQKHLVETCFQFKPALHFTSGTWNLQRFNVKNFDACIAW